MSALLILSFIFRICKFYIEFVIKDCVLSSSVCNPLDTRENELDSHPMLIQYFCVTFVMSTDQIVLLLLLLLMWQSTLNQPANFRHNFIAYCDNA